MFAINRLIVTLSMFNYMFRYISISIIEYNTVFMRFRVTIMLIIFSLWKFNIMRYWNCNGLTNLRLNTNLSNEINKFFKPLETFWPYNRETKFLLIFHYSFKKYSICFSFEYYLFRSLGFPIYVLTKEKYIGTLSINLAIIFQARFIKLSLKLDSVMCEIYEIFMYYYYVLF